MLLCAGQAMLDRAEHGAQGGADAGDRRDDGERDTGRNQSVLDRSRAGLFLPKILNQCLHSFLPRFPLSEQKGSPSVLSGRLRGKS
jgi:hypothetical protein